MKYACHQEVFTLVEKDFFFKVQSDILFQLLDNENFIRKNLKKKKKKVDFDFFSCRRTRQFQNKAIATKISECCMGLFLKKKFLSHLVYVFP